MFVGYLNDDMAAFVAILPQPGIVDNQFRISRVVVLPDFQGLGLGNIMNEYLGEVYWEDKKYLSIVTTHPGLIKSYIFSKSWKLKSFDKTIKIIGDFGSTELSARLKASFIYIPKAIRKSH